MIWLSPGVKGALKTVFVKEPLVDFGFDEITWETTTPYWDQVVRWGEPWVESHSKMVGRVLRDVFTHERLAELLHSTPLIGNEFRIPIHRSAADA